MHLIKLSLPLTKLTGSGFKHSTSALLSAITLGGVCSTLIFNSDTASSKLNESFETISKILIQSNFYDGIKIIGNTLKGWGEAIVTSKDDFKDWLYRYLGPDGFKSGVANLYEKLNDWALIVYTWFKDKFIEFIKNIPDMVENWKKLRFTLFKWGTFLGGGGGSAIWGILSNGNNWDKLSALIGNPQFANLVDKFSTVLDQNSKAFGEMNEEESKEMLEAMLDDPDSAEEILDELMEDRKEKNEKKKEELNKQGKEQEKEEELEKNEILEKFKNSVGGSPSTPTQAFGNMVKKALQTLSKLDSNKTWSIDITHKAKTEMKNYINTLKDDVKKKGRKSDVKEQFLKAIEGNEESFAYSLAESAKEAYEAVKNKEPLEYSILAEKFATILENKFTIEATEEDEGEKINLREAIPQSGGN